MLLLQVVWPDGTFARFHGGEVVEMDVRAVLKTALLAERTAGVLTEKAIDRAIVNAFESFKAKVVPARLKMPAAPPDESA